VELAPVPAPGSSSSYHYACTYCYARASHTYLGLNAGSDFENKIFIKVNVVEVLRAELGRRSWRGEQIALGTATDCYQPVEGRYRLTRRLLEVLLAHENPLGLVTKSPMVLRDLDVLSALARVAPVRVFFTITTVDPALARTLEPGTAPPEKRLRVLRRLSEAGVPCGVLMAPVLPGLTESAAAIEAVMAAAAEHGATHFGAGALRLMPFVKEHYLGFVGERFPDLVPAYERTYRRVNAPAAYLGALEERIDALRARYGFDEDAMRRRRLVPEAPSGAQPVTEVRQLPLLA
jgi:DNA repair photolyase